MLTITTKTQRAAGIFTSTKTVEVRELLRDGVRVATIPADWTAEQLAVALPAANAYLAKGEDSTSEMIAACNGDADVIAIAHDLINA